jgi:hypothetical protein
MLLSRKAHSRAELDEAANALRRAKAGLENPEATDKIDDELASIERRGKQSCGKQIAAHKQIVNKPSPGLKRDPLTTEDIAL